MAFDDTQSTEQPRWTNTLQPPHPLIPAVVLTSVDDELSVPMQLVQRSRNLKSSPFSLSFFFLQSFQNGAERCSVLALTNQNHTWSVLKALFVTKYSRDWGWGGCSFFSEKVNVYFKVHLMANYNCKYLISKGIHFRVIILYMMCQNIPWWTCLSLLLLQFEWMEDTVSLCTEISPYFVGTPESVAFFLLAVWNTSCYKVTTLCPCLPVIFLCSKRIRITTEWRCGYGTKVVNATSRYWRSLENSLEWWTLWA